MGVLTRGAGMGDQPGADGEEAARDQLRRKRPRGGGRGRGASHGGSQKTGGLWTLEWQLRGNVIIRKSNPGR